MLGAGGRTRTYEAGTARDLQSLVIATRRLQQLGNSLAFLGKISKQKATLQRLCGE